MLYLWLPGCHGNHRCPQNVPKVWETKMFLNHLYYVFHIGLDISASEITTTVP